VSKSRKQVPCNHHCGTMIRPDSNKSGTCRSCLDAGAYVKPPQAPVSEGLDVQGDKAVLTKQVPAYVQTLEQLIEACSIDTTVWEVERYTCQAMQQGAVPRATRPDAASKWVRPSSEVVVTQLYNVKAWLKRKVEVISMRDEIASMIEEAKQFVEPRPLPNARGKGGAGNGYLLMPSIPDLHVGKLAWAPETGGAHYDSRIAVELYHEALFKLVERTGAFNVERIVLPIGNDLLNSDNVQQTTTRGTQQLGDGRWHKTYKMVREMLTSGILFLRQLAPVHVVIVPGNHDQQAMWTMGELLRTRFHYDEHITFDNDPVLWKFDEWHKNMFMFLHGDKGKRPDYPNVMARLKKDMWGRTEHREVHTGHLHTKQVEERYGTKIFISPALCPPDAWHAENLYVGNARQAEASVYHPEEGRVSTATYTVQEAR
jgi:hypothetical protein